LEYCPARRQAGSNGVMEETSKISQTFEVFNEWKKWSGGWRKKEKSGKQMKTIKSFDWILNIINEVIIINNDYTVISCGIEIKNTLLGHIKNINSNFLDNFIDNNEKKIIKGKIDSVLDSFKFDSLELKSLTKTLFFLPAKYNNVPHIIISTSKQILRNSIMEHDLKERIKELECLYNISSVFELTDNLEEALKESIHLLKNGFQFPENIKTSIKIDNKIYGDKICKEDKVIKSLSKDIIVNNKKRGRLHVCYFKEFNFVEEEDKLLKEISVLISEAIGKKDRVKNIEQQRKLLLTKNKKLLELTEECGKSRKRLKTLFNAITDTILVIDSNFNIEMTNKSEIEDSGKCYKKIFAKDRHCDKCPAIKTFETQEATTTEIEISGQYYLLQAYPIFNDKGDVEKVLEISRDITKEKQIELQLLQTDKLASLGKLVSGIAHEINNPNTFIRGNIKIIKESFDDILPILDNLYENQKDLKIARLDYNIYRENIPTLVDDILNGANRIKKIVEDLRNFARKDEGLLTDEIKINDVIKNSIRLVENQIKRHSKINLNLEAGIPELKGSIQKLEQVIVNLLLNASEAIESNNGNISIQTNFDDSANTIIIKIADNGRGIGGDTIKSIFDPFFTTKRKMGGTGLGLSIAYGIIEEHNGKIKVESKSGIGTTFTISIPILNQES
jgi:signal transduction histidine kinase/AraC-like DNA-binding protein